MRTAHILAAGIPALAASRIVGEVALGQTALGSTQTDALILSVDTNEFTTVATGTGARLPNAMDIGDTIEVYNFGANALALYPPVGVGINALAANTAFSVAVGARVLARRISATRIITFLSA